MTAPASGADKRADLAGPGIGSYDDLEAVLPRTTTRCSTPRETQTAIYAAKQFIEDGLCRELGLQMVQVPLIVDAGSGVNDMLDRDGSRTPVSFRIQNDHGVHPIDAQVVQAATKWKRMALAQFDMGRGRACAPTCARCARTTSSTTTTARTSTSGTGRRAITAEERTLDTLKDTVRRIWSVLVGAERHVQELFPALRDPRYPDLPDEITFIHAEDLLSRYPDLPRKQRETMLLQDVPAVFIIGIGWTLDDGYPHEMRAADYDDWVTPTISAEGRPVHGLNGDILVWNPVTRRRHELSSMGVRVDADALRHQLELTGQLDWLELPYHRGIVEGDARCRSAAASASRARRCCCCARHIWARSASRSGPVLKDMCARKDIHVLE